MPEDCVIDDTVVIRKQVLNSIEEEQHKTTWDLNGVKGRGKPLTKYLVIKTVENKNL